MAGIEHTDIQQTLQQRCADIGLIFEEQEGVLVLTIAQAEALPKVLQLLYEAPLGFTFLADLCGVHYPHHRGKEIAVVYQLRNLPQNKRLCVKVFVPSEKPEVPTASQLFSSANWMERETYDFFGVHFVGHPYLKRILNVEEMTYFPLRKEYPLQDATRLDKDDEMFGRMRNNEPYPLT